MDDPAFSPNSFLASAIDPAALEKAFEPYEARQRFTRPEQMLLLSIKTVLTQTPIDVKSPETLILISTTKGNVHLLKNPAGFDQQRIHLWAIANVIQRYFKTAHRPMIISNACISGVLALLTGWEMIRTGAFKNVIVAGVDVLSEFIVSGFRSLQALSDGPCRPFDENRNGLTLGEGCATVLLTADEKWLSDKTKIKITGGATANDANHISGPSRDGEGLYLAIKRAMAGNESSLIDHICAHGTATIFNDEMEAKAVTRAGLENVPINSLKGYFGHTLGAAGLIESVITLQAMRENRLIPTMGFQKLGVSQKINVIREPESRSLRHCLKTAAGFGGCNAAVLFSKVKSS